MKFDGVDEAVEVKLDTPLTDGQTEVTFTYDDVEYTADLDEAFVDAVIVDVALTEANDVAFIVFAGEEEVTAEADGSYKLEVGTDYTIKSEGFVDQEYTATEDESAKELTLVTVEAEAAKGEFLTELKTSVENTGIVESVEIDGENITTTFKNEGLDTTINGVIEAAQALMVEFNAKAEDNKITIEGNSIDLNDESNAPIQIASILFGLEKEAGLEELTPLVAEFITNGGEQVGGYVVNITHEEENFDLSGDFTFKINKVN